MPVFDLGPALDAALATNATLDEVSISNLRADAAAQVQATVDTDAIADAIKAKDDLIDKLNARIKELEADMRLCLAETPPELQPVAPPATMSARPVRPSTGFDPLTQLTATTTGFTGALKPSGGIITSKDGQVIENMDVSGRITVQHKNVTIKNCRVTNSEYYAVFAPDDQGHDVSGLVVDHCSISGAVNGIAGKGTFSRNNISKVDNGVNVWGPSVISENYIHDLGSVMSAGAGHNDGIENNGSGMTLLRNRIEASNSKDTSAVMTNNEFGPLINVLIDGNYISGGQYTLYCDNSKSSEPVSNFIVTNNTIKKGNYGHAALYTSGVDIGPSNKLI